MYNCSDHKDQLLDYFDLVVSKDKDDTHPTRFCNPCYTTLKRLEAGAIYTSATTNFTWTQHTDNCLVRLRCTDKCTHIGL